MNLSYVEFVIIYLVVGILVSFFLENSIPEEQVVKYNPTVLDLIRVMFITYWPLYLLLFISVLLKELLKKKNENK